MTEHLLTLHNTQKESKACVKRQTYPIAHQQKGREHTCVERQAHPIARQQKGRERTCSILSSWEVMLAEMEASLTNTCWHLSVGFSAVV